MLSAKDIQDIHALSPLQEGMLFHSLLEESPAYLEQMSYSVSGELSVSVLKKSFDELFKRHEILRSVFSYKKGGKMLQVVLKERQVDFYYQDISSMEANKQEEFIDCFKTSDLKKTFDLTKDVLMRIAVIKRNDDTHDLIWSHHHILMDGWSARILTAEFFKIYNSFYGERQYSLPEVKPYKTFISWLQKTDAKKSGDFWNEYLTGYDKVSAIPRVTKSKLSTNLFVKVEKKFKLGRWYKSALQKISLNNSVTLNDVIQTAWGILISKYNNSGDVVFGTVVSGRPPEIQGIETMIGLFINTIPVRFSYDVETTFVDLVQKRHAESLASNSHQFHPLFEIQSSSGLNGSLFDHILVFENYPLQENIESLYKDSNKEASLSLKFETVSIVEQTNYDFHLEIVPSDELGFIITFNSAVIDSGFVENIIEHFRTIIRQVADNENLLIKDIQIVSGTELDLIDKYLKGTCVSTGPGWATLARHWDESSKVNSQKTAIVFGDQQITYEALSKEVNKLASYLMGRKDLRRTDAVGVMASHSEKVIVAMLAILKAGFAFIPIDPAYPDERVSEILKSAQIPLLLTESEYLFKVPEFKGQMFALDVQLELLQDIPTDFPEIYPDDLAYLIFTSGSTGKPKGVKIKHSSIVNYCEWANSFYFSNTVGNNFAFFTSISFDLTLTSIFTTLIRGDQVIIFNQQDIIGALGSIFRKGSNVDVVKLTPSHITALELLAPKEGSDVSIIIVGGEQLTSRQVQFLKKLNSGFRIFNEYGPTETTVGCTVKEVNAEELISIGRPISNTEVYILSDHLTLQPVNVFGEICVSGAGISAGYLNDDALTSNKFVLNPYTKQKVHLLYKTGDIARWLPNGDLELIGRKDDQVKIRGYRIEPGEISHVIGQVFNIEACHVVVKESTDDIYLIAYYIATEVIETSVFIERLKSHLPDAMIPQYFVRLSSFPLTPHNKIDKRQLPDPRQLENNGYKGDLPINHIEEKLLEIWTQILSKKRIRKSDDFFAIGGHSIKATQLMSSINMSFDVAIDLVEIFNRPTISELADLIRTSVSKRFASIEKNQPAPHYETSSAQKRLWFLDQFNLNKTEYIVPVGIELEGDLNVNALKVAFTKLAERHESLRTTFLMINGEVRQKITSVADFRIDYKETDLTLSDSRRSMEEILESEITSPFNLNEGPLFRVRLYFLPSGRYALIVLCHHIISDAWSMKIMSQEVSQLYNSIAQGSDHSLTELPIQYKDYASWQNKLAESKQNEKEKKYWVSKFAGGVPMLNLPCDRPRSQSRTSNGASLSFEIDENLTANIRNYCSEAQVTLFSALLTTSYCLLYRLSHQIDFVIGTPINGRDHADAECIIGNCLNTLALRMTIDPNESFREFTIRVKKMVLESLSNRTYPFEQLVHDLAIERNLSRSPLFDIMIVVNNHATLEVHPLNGIATSVITFKKSQSKYDMILTFNEYEKSIHCDLEYNQDLFEDSTIHVFKDYYLNILRMLLTNNGDTTLSSITSLANESPVAISDFDFD